MTKLLMVVMALASTLQADDFIEGRISSHNEYRYADWSHSFQNKLVTDVYYIGVPGNNEADACLGYSLPTFSGITITPFLCGTIAKEDKEAGVKSVAMVSFEKGKFKADAYYGHFTPLRGNVSSYDVLDAGNLTYAVSKRWEVGVSTGFFRQYGKWNPLLGPLVRRNDPLGFWAVSYRLGPASELRFSRTLTFKKH